MSEITRFGVSLEKEMLAAFDRLCESRGYSARSEAIRDLIRATLAEEQWGEAGECSGTLTLVYDHHKHDLARRIMAIQHECHDIIIATLHVHLDHDNCLETLVLKGDAKDVKLMAQSLIACKGVKYGAFNRAPGGAELR